MAASIDVISGGRRMGGGRRVVPLLPAQQSPSERVAHNKNRVLHRRLQLHLNMLTKHRRSWLLQTHIQAARYRQRAEHLHHLTTPSHSPTSDPSLPHPRPFSCHDDLTSARDVCTRHNSGKSRNQRPATSVHFRFTSRPRGGHDDKRPSTAAAHPPRSQPVEAWSDCRKPLSSPPDNEMTPSSDEDDTDSEYSAALTDGSENGDRDGKTARFDKTAPTVHTYLSGNKGSGHSLVKKQTQNRTQSAFIRTPQLLPASHVMGDAPGRPWAEPRSHTGRDSQKHTDENHQKQFLGRPGSFRQRAQTAPGTSRSCKSVAPPPGGSGGRVVQSGGGGGRRGGGIFGCGRGPRDANYIHYVLNQERDKYELSQMKVRDYLQSLKI